MMSLGFVSAPARQMRAATPYGSARARNHLAAVVLVASTAISLAFTVLRSSILPEKFSYDAEFIQAIARGSHHQMPGESFGSIGLIYRAMHLQDSEIAAGVLSIGVFLALVLLGAARLEPGDRARYLLLCAPAIILAGIFYGTYNKELVVAVVILVALSRRPRRFDLVVSGAAAACGVFFREYWLLIAAMYVGLQIVRGRNVTVRRLVLLVAAGAVVLVLAFNVVLGVDVDHYRQLVNSGRVGSADAQTAIGRLYGNTSIPGQVVNYLLSLSAVLTWFPLVAHGSIFYYAAIAYVVPLNLLMVRRWMTSREGADRFASVASLWVSFVFVQATFEPDFGSLLRHSVVFFPVVIAALMDGRSRAREGSVP